MTSLKLLRKFAFSLLLAGAALVASPSARADEYSEVSALTNSGKQADAISRAEKFLANKPKDAQMRFLKGVAQAESGRTGDAIFTFTKLAEDHPELPEPYNNLGVIYAADGQFDKARSALEAALRTSPSYSTAHENLGDVYAKLASQAYINALQFDASNATAKPKLALIRDLFSSTGKDGKRGPPLVASAGSGSPATSAPSTASAISAPLPPQVAAATSSGKVGNLPAPPTSTAPPTVPRTAPTEPGDGEVRVAVAAWAAAWSSKDLGAYFASYAKEFSPPGNSGRAAWEAERRSRIVGKKHIDVKVEQLQVQITGNSAIAKFKQHYNADSLNVSSRKRLEMVRSGDRWLIVKEATGD